MRDAEAEFGPVDMMFANAGIAGLGDIGKQDPADWDEMIAINVNGVMNSVHAVMSGMMARRHGTLVMMSSIAGRKVYPDHTVYCGTNILVHGVSESLREYLSELRRPGSRRFAWHHRDRGAGRREGSGHARELQGEQGSDRRRHRGGSTSPS